MAKKDVTITVEAMMKVIRDAMCNEENVYLRGFGTFVVKKRAEKTARNITKEVTITIPAHDIPAFKPSKAFVGQIKK